MAKEIELKLRLAPESTAQLAQWLDAHADAGRESRLLNDYYDTPDLALAGPRAALRIRTSDSGERKNYADESYEQTFKTRGDSEAAVQVRNEWNWPLAERALDLTYLRSPEVADHWPHDADMDALNIVFTTHFQRRRWLWKHDGAEVEVVIDQGEIKAGEHHQPLCETELEVYAGQAEALWVLLAQMQQQAPLWLSDVSKAERGYRLAGCEVHHFHADDTQPQVLINHVFDLQRACEQVIWNNASAMVVWQFGYPLWSLLPISQREPLTRLLRRVLSESVDVLQGSSELAIDLTLASRRLAELSTESQLSQSDHLVRLVEARRQLMDVIECSDINTNTFNIDIKKTSELLTLIKD